MIVLCCPIAVVAADSEDSSSTEVPQNAQEENKTFRDCVLKEKKWKTKCIEHLEQENHLDINNPYSTQGGLSSNLVPERGGVWGPTPAEVYRKYDLSDHQVNIRS